MRLGPPPEVEEEPGQFWKDFIRETAPVFRKPTIDQLGGVHRADLACALRRRALRRRSAARDLRRDRARRDRRGQRRLLPGDPRTPAGPWARIVSCNPLELKDRRDPARVLRATRLTTATGWDEFRAEYSARDRRPARRVLRVLRGARRLRSFPTAEFIHESRLAQPVRCTRRRSTIARSAASRADLASARDLRSTLGRASRASGRTSPPETERSCTSRSAASARPTSTS